MAFLKALLILRNPAFTLNAMNFTQVAFYLLAGLLAGAGTVFLIFVLFRKQIIKKAENEAE